MGEERVSSITRVATGGEDEENEGMLKGCRRNGSPNKEGEGGEEGEVVTMSESHPRPPVQTASDHYRSNTDGSRRTQ